MEFLESKCTCNLPLGKGGEGKTEEGKQAFLASGDKEACLGAVLTVSLSNDISAFHFL